MSHLQSVTPWNCAIEVSSEEAHQPFQTSTDGIAYEAMRTAMKESYGIEATTFGQGASPGLANAFARALPRAELLMLGVSEPLCAVHEPNESVDPNEIEQMALSLALFLRDFADKTKASSG